MKRRTWLKLGLGSSAALVIGGGWFAATEPGWAGGRFSPWAEQVMRSMAKGLLSGSLPEEAVAQEAALSGLLLRLSDAVSALPTHAQQELCQLLALLGTSPGRWCLAGVSNPWELATVADVQAGLHAMRFSHITLRQQAYQALHDLTGAAYFSSRDTWTALGYPGPRGL